MVSAGSWFFEILVNGSSQRDRSVPEPIELPLVEGRTEKKLRNMNLSENLALACLYVMGGRAQPFFPGTDRCAPSFIVRVLLTLPAPYRESDRCRFPMDIKWDLWELMVPLIESETYSPKLPVNQHLLRATDFDQLVLLMTGRVEEALREAGRIP